MRILSMCFMLVLISCKAISQDINKIKKMDGHFEKFDMKDYVDKRDRTVEGGDDLNRFFLKDGTEIYRVGYADEYTEEVIFPKPSFFKLNKVFYPSGFIKEKGLSFGAIDMGANGIKVGKWYYFNEQGKLTRTVDEDLKFGKFSYEQVLAFLDKEGMISLKTGKNRDKAVISFDLNGDHAWHVEVTTAFVPDNYSSGWKYRLDGSSGKVLEKKKFNISYAPVIN